MQLPWLGRNLLRLGNFRERAIGNPDNFSDCSPSHDLESESGKNCTSPEFEALLRLCVVIYENGNFDQ